MRETCPRCGGKLSRRPVASRTDDQTRVCAACGTEEALELVRDELTPRDHWPVERRRTVPAGE